MFGTRITALIGAVVAGLLMAIGGANAHDESKYPDFNGQWRRAGQVGGGLRGLAFDPAKPFGLEQRAPLTAEYQTLPIWRRAGRGLIPPLRACRPACRVS